ncbi:MaoC family dehydratase N-terminal domain-containing protein [Streptomyces sp. NPDC051211]|uniref:FAS1-like dehydratase domain-containing protein n=1 Tax=Streptomyces sp. NPDC051211 TaxID=3154643 RepID=UPI00344CEAB9
MLIAETMAGTLPPYRVSLDREDIRRFADAIGATEAVHRDAGTAREAGYRDVVAPPTYLFGVDLDRGGVFRLLAEAGADPASCLHVEQEFSHLSPACAGDTLVFSPRFEMPPLPARGATQFVARHTVVDRADGTPVAVLRQLVAVRTGGETGGETGGAA